MAWTPQLQQIMLPYHRSKHGEKSPSPARRQAEPSASLWKRRRRARDQKEKEPDGMCMGQPCETPADLEDPPRVWT